MAITVTEKAARHIRNALARKGGVGLRLGVRTVGCSGLAYTFDYADEVRADDRLFESHDVKVVVDGKSLAFVDGSELDYAREGLNESFKVKNPKATAMCGCGESFTVEKV
ncbi:MAG TPA: iron-sulfur cluster assembly accessory protein [Burkholderiales bacterium]|nr:iron-sulfur cluster assembly accessory protein [Burkholderiales bacterium]